MQYNKATLVGNLTADPELKSTDSGTKITTFSLATNRKYKDGNGQQQEDVQFHNVVVFGRQAENCAQYLQKGQQALVEGRIQTRSWEKDDQKHYRTEIVAYTVQFGNKPQGGEFEKTSKEMKPKKENYDGIDYPDAEGYDESQIPF